MVYDFSLLKEKKQPLVWLDGRKAKFCAITPYFLLQIKTLPILLSRSATNFVTNFTLLSCPDVRHKCGATVCCSILEK